MILVGLNYQVVNVVDAAKEIVRPVRDKGRAGICMMELTRSGGHFSV